MSIRTESEFVFKVDEQLIWRRKELTELRGLIANNRSNATKQALLIRAGVSLLYAHWEGFIKSAGTYFLQFVSAQRLTPEQLKPNFVGIILRNHLDSASKSKKVSTTTQLVEFFCTKMTTRVHLPTKNIIDTESNLSSVVFCEILFTLGLDAGQYETRHFIIDKRLVGNRNCIAHGENLNLTFDDYMSLHDDVLSLMNEFRDQIQNACSGKTFKR